MRVRTVRNQTSNRLAIAYNGQWCMVEPRGAAASSVDALVRGGEEAKRAIETARASATPITAPVSWELCIPWPNKILCVGLNYRRHAQEAHLPLTKTPVLFSKFNSSLAKAGQPVPLPSNATQYDYEAELGVIIGKRAHRVSPTAAADYIWGYCNCNDLSARDLQMRTSQHLLGKTLDGFLPVGPDLVSADEVGDPQGLAIRTWLNGELRQDSTTGDMVFTVCELVSYISQYIPLEAGDFIATGTPEGVILGRKDKVWMKPGDVVEVEISSLGRLTTPLVAGP